MSEEAVMFGEKDNSYSDEDKAIWILENGAPDVAWVFERVNDIIYIRPAGGSKNIPPWIDLERQEYANLNNTTGFFEGQTQ